MKTRGVHLQYSFAARGQRGAEVQNPLFDLLQAVATHGSIQQAARALGLSYRHVWGSLKHWEAELGQPLLHWTQGQPARLTAFAQRLLWAETRARARLVPHIEALRTELERVLAEALDGTTLALSVVASHDLALPLLRDLALATARLHVDLRFAGSMDALRALAEGRCAVAGFHVPPLAHRDTRFARGLEPLLEPGRHKLIGCMRRTQGLMVARGNPLGLTDLASVHRAGARFVSRQPGSGTRLLTEHLLAEQGLPADALGHAPPSVSKSAAGSASDGASDSVSDSASDGVPDSTSTGATDAGRAAALPVEDSHLAVAAAVAAGVGDAALGIEAAARAFGLEFLPLVEEAYYLVSLARTLDEAPVQALRAVLQRAEWADLLRSQPGYAPHHAGEVLSLTRALPWWHFDAPKGEAAPAVPGKRAPMPPSSLR